MLEQLLAGLKPQVTGELKDKAGVNPNMIDDIIKITGQSAAEEVGKEMMGGNLDVVMNLFSNKSNNDGANALQGNITNNVLGGLVQQLGLNKQTANMVTSIVIPVVMNLITNKNSETPDNDSSPLESIFKSALGGGGKSDGIGGLLGGLGGLLGGK